MATDRYLELVNSGIGSAIADRVGLPKPPVLRRYAAGEPLLHGPALVGGLEGVPASVVKALEVAGVDVKVELGADERPAALIFDARAVGKPADLAQLREFLSGQLKRLKSNGRVLVLGLRPEGTVPARDAARQGLDGIVRSLAKELRGGSTANLLLVEDEASLPAALRFFLSGKAAYVDGQPLLLAAGEAPEPADWSRPLAGKTALVPGAARGIGAAIAEVLSRDGAHVIAADLPQAGEALAKVANKIGGSSLHLNVAATDAPERLLEHLSKQTKGLDILIHNAGITRDKLLANMKPEQWDAVIAVNLESQLAINDALLASDQLNPQSRVVCLSSTTGFAGNRGQTNYGATKAAVIGLVRAYADAFAAKGSSTINAVAPGFIE
ncbi:MAG: 3-oxoacyl-ACP reductase, partial [Jatrophihabitans sp.]|uniref:3-oxoacyl-ACP reductase n=1 Tax=Jatrophihabitans sp. TaxID=1932789 RepID=UPI003F80F1A3